LQAKTNTIEYKKAEAEKEEKPGQDEREMNILGVRLIVANPIPACEKIDKIFGSGGEAIIHYMWFEQGNKLFEQMLQNSPDKTKEELLRQLIDAQPQTGWGTTKITIVRTDPPTVEIAVKNSPVKTIKGSQKRLIGSFWAGVFARYFDRPLTPKNFAYDNEKDEFSCSVTT